MKKYILGFVVTVICLFSSCTNDDVTIAYQTTIKINPSTVVSPFESFATGDLELLTSDYKLRTRLLVYDEDGNLTYQDVKFLNNFTETMTSSPNLPEGKYTAVATTDIVKYDNSEVSFQFWALSDSTEINTVKLADTGYIGNQRSILGVKSASFSVSKSGNDILSMSVKPAGALFFVLYKNIHTYSNIYDLGVTIQKANDYLSFDNNGNNSASFKSNGTNYDYWMVHFDPSDNYYSSSTHIYDYAFILPASNYGIKFELDFTSGSTKNSNYYGGWNLNIEAGQEYSMSIDLADKSNNFSPTCGVLTVSGTKAINHPTVEKSKYNTCNNNNTLYLKNCN